MPQGIILFGLILILTGAIAYFGTGRESLTALFPVIAGIPILLAGWVATRPGWRRFGLYSATGLAIVLALGTLRGVFALLGGDVTTASVINMALLVASVVFLVFCVSWIRNSREARRAD
jgi:hypothetical protein